MMRKSRALLLGRSDLCSESDLHTRKGHAESSVSTAPRSVPLHWEQLFEEFFSDEPDESARAVATFARMIRFWIVRIGAHEGSFSTDDLVQDVLLELTRSRSSIHDPGAVGGWLRTTTTRKVQDRWRSAQRIPAWLCQDEPELLPEPALLPDEQVLRKQDHSDLLEAIAQLPPLLCQCIRLQLRGLSELEIARRLEAESEDAIRVPVHNVKNWLRKARSLLRSALLEGAP